ncbi:MAG: SAV_6107 family HEPN domain-containing protein [Mycobacteriaceae bacterium]|uniref:SAV_6107 family HEPN domain-containing protein n=1 Tax=Corynebacterium sp. TaxID=1720 RepID=UPI003F96974A
MSQGTASTVARLSRSGRGGAALPETFIIEAERLLERSRLEPDTEQQLTWAYRGALRAAGAVIQYARKKRRRLPAGSAWARVRVLAEDMDHWCDLFEKHSRLVTRTEMGLEPDLAESVVAEVYRDACDFLDDVRGMVGYLPEVA